MAGPYVLSRINSLPHDITARSSLRGLFLYMVTAKIAVSGELLFRSGDVIENAPVSYFVAV